MRIGYLDCFAGISGDMLLGALVDAGVSRSLLEETVLALDLGASLRFSSVDRSGITATKVDVIDAAGKAAEHQHHPHPHHHHHHHHDHDHSHLELPSRPSAEGSAGEAGHTHTHKGQHHDHHPHVHGRTWKQVQELIQRARLSPQTRDLSLRAFAFLAQAEAKIHGVEVEDVHFHEVGAVDTITDIVCAAAGLSSLGVDKWYASAVNTGSGFVECAHGTFPVPAPATAELLKGVPTFSTGPQKEMTTPTGAALLKALDCEFGNVPPFAASTIGYGAGTRNPERFPNVLRLSIGDTAATKESVTVLECALDDATPQIIAHAMDRALEAGALDVMCSPVVMKKGRMGSLLTLLCRADKRPALENLLLTETTTLGIRVHEEERILLERRFMEAETEYGRIRIKVASRNGEDLNRMPEYEDCLRAAQEHHVPLKQVMQAALAAASDTRVKA
jgi:uncharacterized protein (TIGR00299 family) protein